MKNVHTLAILGFALFLTASAVKTPGVILTDVINDAEPRRIIVQPDGKLTVLGNYMNVDASGSKFQYFLARFNADGSFDNAFGKKGVVLEAFGGTDLASDFVMQPDGKFVTVISSELDSSSKSMLVRYNPDGSRDTKFGIQGITTFSFTEFLHEPLAVSVLPNGSFLVTGNLISFGAGGALLQTYSLTKFTENGVLDKSFADDGLYSGDFIDRFIVSEMLYRQPDGKLLIGGADPKIDPRTGRYTMVVARLLENGQPDTSFGERGIARITAIDGGVMPKRIYGLPNGQLVIAGVSDLDFRQQFALTRLTAQGRLDLTFAQNGRALYSMDNKQTELLTDMVIQPDERILLTGYVFHDNGISLALARVLSNGKLDTQFANGGILTETLGNQYAAARAVAVQQDGKVLVAGDVRSDSSDRLLMLARYNTDGTRDTTFAIK